MSRHTPKGVGPAVSTNGPSVVFVLFGVVVAAAAAVGVVMGSQVCLASGGRTISRIDLGKNGFRGLGMSPEPR